MRSPLPLLILALLPTLALGQADPRFAALQAQSEPLGALGPFLEKYVGLCDGVEERTACEAQAVAFRKQVAGKRFYMLRSDDAAHLLAPGPYDPDSGELTVLLTPIFGAHGLALTSGKPQKLDAAGNPVMKLVKLPGRTRQGFSAGHFERLFRQGELRLELVFTPESTWTLRGRAKPVRGVQARMLGVAVVHARSGETIAAWAR